MTDAAIRSASECPCNEGTANFTVDSKSYRYPWVVGLIQIETRSIGYVDPEAFQNQPPRYRFEDFVVVYDDLGNERVSFPRRCAMVEYFPRAARLEDLYRIAALERELAEWKTLVDENIEADTPKALGEFFDGIASELSAAASKFAELEAQLAEAKEWQERVDNSEWPSDWEFIVAKHEDDLAEAKKDSARLDFLDFLDETDQSFYWPEDQPVRAVIDAAKGE